MSSNQERADVACGMRIARSVFEKRGNHSEAHLSEGELAALLAIAFRIGRDHERTVHDLAKSYHDELTQNPSPTPEQQS